MYYPVSNTPYTLTPKVVKQVKANLLKKYGWKVDIYFAEGRNIHRGITGIGNANVLADERDTVRGQSECEQ